MKEICCKYIYEQYIIVTARCRLQYHMNVSQTLQTFWMEEIAYHEEYKHFKWKRMHIMNITKVLNGRKCLLQT